MYQYFALLCLFCVINITAAEKQKDILSLKNSGVDLGAIDAARSNLNKEFNQKVTNGLEEIDAKYKATKTPTPRTSLYHDN